MSADALVRPVGEPTRRDWIAVFSAMLGAFMSQLAHLLRAVERSLGHGATGHGGRGLDEGVVKGIAARLGVHSRRQRQQNKA